MKDPERSLAAKTRTGMSWTAVGAGASNLVRLAVIAILSRLLAPEDFGVVATAMVLILFASLLKDLGVGLALVQRKDLEPEHVETAFTFSVLLGLSLSAVIAGLAGPIARFFHMEEAVDVVRVLGLLFTLRSLGLVSGFLCKREMSFRAIALIDFVAYFAGSAVSVALAFAGYGVWALVIGYVVETALNVGLLLIVAPPPWRLRLSRRHLGDLLGFGLGKSLANIGNYFANQGDYMVIGRALDKTQLGLYQRAYELVRFPANLFSTVAGGVLFSAFSKIQDDPARLGRAYRRATFASALVLLPAAAGLLVLAPEAVRILLGGQWGEAVWPFRIMALTMLFRTTYKLGGLVGRSAGQVFKVAGWQVVYATLVIGGAAASVAWGIAGVACTTALAVAVNFVAMTRLGIAATDLRAIDIVRAHAMPLAIAAAVGGAAWACATALRAAELHYAIVAAVTTVVGGGLFLALAGYGLARGGDDWSWLRETLLQMLRPRMKSKKRKKNP